VTLTPGPSPRRFDPRCRVRVVRPDGPSVDSHLVPETAREVTAVTALSMSELDGTATHGPDVNEEGVRTNWMTGARVQDRRHCPVLLCTTTMHHIVLASTPQGDPIAAVGHRAGVWM
jgi:hypothetical protein